MGRQKISFAKKQPCKKRTRRIKVLKNAYKNQGIFAFFDSQTASSGILLALPSPEEEEQNR
jgi:hypothetical protein